MNPLRGGPRSDFFCQASFLPSKCGEVGSRRPATRASSGSSSDYTEGREGLGSDLSCQASFLPSRCGGAAHAGPCTHERAKARARIWQRRAQASRGCPRAPSTVGKPPPPRAVHRAASLACMPVELRRVEAESRRNSCPPACMHVCVQYLSSSAETSRVEPSREVWGSGSRSRPMHTRASPCSSSVSSRRGGSSEVTSNVNLPLSPQGVGERLKPAHAHPSEPMLKLRQGGPSEMPESSEHRSGSRRRRRAPCPSRRLAGMHACRAAPSRGGVAKQFLPACMHACLFACNICRAAPRRVESSRAETSRDELR